MSHAAHRLFSTHIFATRGIHIAKTPKGATHMTNFFANFMPNITGKARPTLPPIIRGLLAATFVALIGTLLLSVIFCHTNVSAACCHALQLPLLGLSALAGGFAGAHALGRRGLVQGAKFGALLLVLLLAASLATGNVNPYALIIKAAIVMLCATLGGIFGVF